MWGNSMKLSLFGESHGEAIGIVIEGLPAGTTIDHDLITQDMNRRKPGTSSLTTSRKESDQVHIISGVYNGKTTGAPLCAMIYNEDHHSSSYDILKTHMRPSHSDYSAYIKYHGYNDIRGGGHFSGRLTAPIVFAGAIAKTILNQHDIYVGAHISCIKDIYDKKFETLITKWQLDELKHKSLPVLDDICITHMKDTIEQARSEKDSVGGKIECAIINVPAGLGNPFFNSLESHISSLMFSIPGVKSITFGTDMTSMHGSEANDEYYYDKEQVKTYTNHNGGILGGISTGMPIVFEVGVKPTPSIGKIQKTINIETKDNVQLELKGRHDPCIVLRAVVVVEAMAALAILDMMNIK